MKINRFNQLQVDYYRSRARSYDKGNLLYGRENRVHLKKIDRILAILEPPTGGKILEVGIGTGIHAQRLLQVKKSLKYYGVDLSREMLEIAEERLRGKGTEAKLILANGENLPFQNNYFDSAFMSGSLHHFSDPQKGVEELVRVLKPGGRFAIVEPNWIFPKNLFAGFVKKEEKNVLKMKIENFRKWTEELPLEDLRMENFLYTPPLPKVFGRCFDLIDRILEKLPPIKYFSIMLCVYGQKSKENTNT